MLERVAAEGVAAPPEDKQQADEHAAQVGEVGHAVVGVEKALDEFQRGIADDEPLGLDGHEEVEVYVFVGEGHAEGQQQAVDGARGTDGEAAGEEHGEQSGAQAAGQVVDEEALGAPEVLHCVAEHPEGEHVEEQVGEVGVHEHICQGLPHAEVASGRVPEAEDVVEVNNVLHAEHVVGQVGECVDDKEVLDCGRQDAEALGLVLCHFSYEL